MMILGCFLSSWNSSLDKPGPPSTEGLLGNAWLPVVGQPSAVFAFVKLPLNVEIEPSVMSRRALKGPSSRLGTLGRTSPSEPLRPPGFRLLQTTRKHPSEAPGSRRRMPRPFAGGKLNIFSGKGANRGLNALLCGAACRVLASRGLLCWSPGWNVKTRDTAQTAFFFFSFFFSFLFPQKKKKKTC